MKKSNKGVVGQVESEQDGKLVDSIQMANKAQTRIIVVCSNFEWACGDCDGLWAFLFKSFF